MKNRIVTLPLFWMFTEQGQGQAVLRDDTFHAVRYQVDFTNKTVLLSENWANLSRERLCI